MAVNNTLVTNNQNNLNKPIQFQAFIKSPNVLANIQSTLGDATRSKNFVASIITAVSNNPALSNCDGLSIVTAALQGETLKLSPSPQLGQMWIVPYSDKAQFQIGYKGYIQLAIRSGQYKKINVLEIKEGELIKFDRINEEIEVRMIDDEFERENAETIGYYAMFEYLNGFRKAIYWTKEKMLKHADKYSQAFSLNEMTINTRKGQKKRVSYYDYTAGNYKKEDEWMYSSYWYKDFDGMALKTMLRQLISKWGIMSIDMQMAFENDMAIFDSKGNKTYEEPTVDPTINENVIDQPTNNQSELIQDEM